MYITIGFFYILTKVTKYSIYIAKDKASWVVSLSDYVSWIFRKYGSWFTELLTTGIRKYRNESKITDILQRLIFSVNCLPIVDERKSTWYMQVPYYTSTLTKALVLSQNGNVNIYYIIQVMKKKMF